MKATAVFMLALSIGSSLVSAAEIEGISMQVGKLLVEGEYATQAIVVKNSTGKKLTRIEIECGFFQGDKIIASATSVVENLDNNEEGFDEVVADGATETESSRCRIVSAE